MRLSPLGSNNILLPTGCNNSKTWRKKGWTRKQLFFYKKTSALPVGVNSKHEIEAALLPYTYLAISLSENNIRPCQLLHAFVTPFFFTYDLFSCFLYTGKV